MSKKKIDMRVEILSYIDHKGDKQYYPAMGFPVEIFVINQHSKPTIFTLELLNASNFVFLTNIASRVCFSVCLKKMLFLGSYLLYDNLSWSQPETYFNMTEQTTNKQKVVVCTIFLSQFLDIKIIQLENITKFNNKIIKSVSGVYKNST
jgi:hypothetical protein